jgi:WhiB family redox-sensing transcriptional regulator
VPATQGTTSKAVHREEWLDAGACRSEDPELFFPITASGPSAQQIAAAKAVCQGCGVQNECLHYALESHQSHGVWGGTSEEERLRMTARPGSRAACTPSTGARRPSPRVKSGREGRNAGYRA